MSGFLKKCSRLIAAILTAAVLVSTTTPAEAGRKKSALTGALVGGALAAGTKVGAKIVAKKVAPEAARTDRLKQAIAKDAKWSDPPASTLRREPLPHATPHPDPLRFAVSDVVRSAAKPHGQTTEAGRALAKKLGHAQAGGYRSAFEGIQPTRENGQRLVEQILSNPHRTIVGDKHVDVYNAAGQGIRIGAGTGKFETFLEAGLERLLR